MSCEAQLAKMQTGRGKCTVEIGWGMSGAKLSGEGNFWGLQMSGSHCKVNSLYVQWLRFVLPWLLILVQPAELKK